MHFNLDQGNKSWLKFPHFPSIFCTSPSLSQYVQNILTGKCTHFPVDLGTMSVYKRRFEIM